MLGDSYCHLHLNESHHTYDYRYVFLLHVIYKRRTSRTYYLSLILLATHTSDCNMASALSQQPNDIVFPAREPEAKKGLSSKQRRPSVTHLPYDI